MKALTCFIAILICFGATLIVARADRDSLYSGDIIIEPEFKGVILTVEGDTIYDGKRPRARWFPEAGPFVLESAGSRSLSDSLTLLRILELDIIKKKLDSLRTKK